MGELLKQFDARGGDRTKKEADLLSDKKEGARLSAPSRDNVAESVGISEHQRKQAVRVANIPEEKFEAAH
jgi:hypothetical protein